MSKGREYYKSSLTLKSESKSLLILDWREELGEDLLQHEANGTAR